MEPVAASGFTSHAWLTTTVPLASAVILLLLGRRYDSWDHLLAAIASWASFSVGTLIVIQMLGVDEVSRRMMRALLTWVPTGEFPVDFGLLVDPLSATFVVPVTFISSFIHAYSTAYAAHDVDRRRFFAYLNLFIVAMLTLVLVDSYAVLFVS